MTNNIKMASMPVDNNRATYQKIMKGAVIIISLSFVMLGVAQGLVLKTDLSWQIVKYFFAVAVISASFLWCLLDSEINNYPFGKYMLVLFVLLLPVAIVIYFYRSRGFKKGSAALMKVAAFLALVLVLAGLCSLLTSRLFVIPN